MVVVKQRGKPPKISRYISQIISPGTNFDYAIDNDDNYINIGGSISQYNYEIEPTYIDNVLIISNGVFPN